MNRKPEYYTPVSSDAPLSGSRPNAAKDLAFDDVTRLIAYVCAASYTAVCFWDKQQGDASIEGALGFDCDDSPAVCQFLTRVFGQPSSADRDTGNDDVVIVDCEAEVAAGFAQELLIKNSLRIRFCAGARLVMSDGSSLGALCVMDTAPHELNGEQKAIMKALARRLARRLELQHTLVARDEVIAQQAQLQAEREQFEQEMAELLEYNRLLLESTAEGIYGIDMQGRCTFINKAGTNLLGCTMEDALGRNMHEFSHHTRLDGSHYPATECPIFNAFRSGTGCQVDSEVFWRKDGTSFRAAYASFPMTTTNGIVGAVITFSDITEKLQHQERERALADAEERANNDPLTGLLNHRAFHRRLGEEADRAQREETSFAVAMLDLDNFKFFNDVYGHVVGDKVLLLVSDALRSTCRSYDIIARFGGDEFSLLLPGVTASTHTALEERLKADLNGIVYRPVEGDNDGAAIPINVSVGVALFPADAADRSEVLERADERLRRAKTSGASETDADLTRLLAGSTVEGFSMLDALVAAVDNKDRYTRNHSEDVMRYSLIIARELDWSDEEIHILGVAALLHDVGKVGVPDWILRKPGKLTEAEFSAIQQHPVMGAALVATVPGLENTLDAVRHHHERWDGSGYASGLRGEDTPPIARLMAVADAFSAMTTDRPYRKGMPHSKAVSILESGAGSQWDPFYIAAFLKALNRTTQTA